jgi:hypothetical protein
VVIVGTAFGGNTGMDGKIDLNLTLKSGQGGIL